MKDTMSAAATAMWSGVAVMAIWSSVAATAQVSVTVESTIKVGWGADGWGACRITLRNAGAQPARFVGLSGAWYAKGEKVEEAWNEKPDKEIPAGGEATHTVYSVLPKKVAEKAAPDSAVIKGQATVRVGEQEQELPLEVAIPEAKLPEPLKLVTGKRIGLELMESRFKDWPAGENAVRWLNQCYEAMIDLTGNVPFDGKVLVIREAPEHPWWAFAGNPIIMSTRAMPETIDELNRGIITFGWVHEFGHCFDTCGEWYIWDGPACEFQANFKLCYAFESIPDQSFKVNRARFKGGAYPVKTNAEPMTGHGFVDAFFLTFGDAYLSDPERKWNTLSSDEMHAFFQRIQRAYGWAPFKAMYRTYARFEQAGLKKPEMPEEKVQLLAAVLSHETGVDLAPMFKLWRFPVTAEDVQAMMAKYPVVREGATSQAAAQTP
jgi:hypothetical protein